MVFYCLNHFVLIGFLISNTVFAAGSETAHTIVVTALSPCGFDFTVSCFLLLSPVELFQISICEI